VTSVAITAYGSEIVSGSSDGTMRVWDAASGVEATEPFLAHKGGVQSVALNNGSRIVSGGNDGTVRVWVSVDDMAVGEAAWVRSVALSADESRIASGGDDGRVRVRDAAGVAADVAPIKGHESQVASLAASADWSRVVSGGYDGTVRVWNADSGAAVGEPLRGHEDWVISVATTADGTRVVSLGLQGTVWAWDIVSGTAAAKSMDVDRRRVRSVAVSVDGSHIYSGHEDGRVRVWDWTSGAAVGEPLEAHNGCVDALSVSADGSFFVSHSANDAVARVWDSASHESVRTILVMGLPRHANSAELLAAAGLSPPPVGARLSTERDAILLTSLDGGSATCLGTLHAGVNRNWLFDESRRVLWVGSESSGPFRIALVE
jgi:WD40 repeat protein